MTLPGRPGFRAWGPLALPGALRGSSPTPAEPPLSLRVSAAIARVRQAIGRRVVDALPGETGAIANALITGERGGITEITNQAFRDSGLFHILSISGPAHGDHGGGGVPLDPADAGGHPIDRAALPDQEMGGGGRHAGCAWLFADLGRGVRHRALLHHDHDHVPGRAAGPAGAGAAQRGAGRACYPRAVAGKPARRRLPDVVCRCGGAGVGL